MAKIKPLVLTFNTLHELEAQKAEYDFMGRETDIDRKNLKLTVLTLPRKYKKKTQRENRAAQRREQDNAPYGDY